MVRIIVHPVMRFCILLFFLGLIVLGALDVSGIKTRISDLVFETYIKIKPRPASDNIVFVDIDDESLTKIGQWPWPRTYVADMIRNINNAGAKVIIFDGVIAEPDRTSPENLEGLFDPESPLIPLLRQQKSHDGELAEAIKEAGNFVAAFTYGSNPEPPLIKRQILIKKDIEAFITSHHKPQSGYFSTTARFLPELEKAAAGNGSFMLASGEDTTIRHTNLVFHDGKKVYPSLILEGLRIYKGDGKGFIRISATPDYNNRKIAEPLQATVENHDIPIGADGKMWIYFRHFKNNESISAYKFINTPEDNALPNLDNKAVFIASSAEGLKDLRATPLGMQPGVNIHMNAFEQILQGSYLIRPYTANILEVGGGAAICVVIIVLSFFISPVLLALFTLLAASGAVWGSWELFVLKGGLIDPVTPVIMMALMFVGASILSFLKTETERKQVRDAFGLYISPDFMRELTSDPDKLKLGGEIRDLSVMFTDIRSFTSISEGLSPEELIQLMNDFLTPMSDLVMQNRGTIDKYMGDAMMAFWNAPLDDPDHQRHACLAALGMQKALEPINKDLTQKSEEQGTKPVILKAGIGINTGPCAVGNMGSRQRFAYSTLGDAVNLASRLEGQTKNYGVGILIGEDTHAAVPELATLEADIITVKGKTKPVRVFVLIGDEALAQSADFQSWKKLHSEMLEQYRSAKFKEAKKIAAKILETAGEDWKILYNLYIERCDAFIQDPPPQGWDGVFVATSK